jgi:hypothetical protein
MFPPDMDLSGAADGAPPRLFNRYGSEYYNPRLTLSEVTNMIRTLATLLLSSAMFASGSARADADFDAALAESRSLAGQLGSQLGAALKKELSTGGPESAIGVCRQVAPDLAGQLSRQSGARVARVSLRTRNPLLGQPDAWEQAVLQDFERRLSAGEKPETLEHAELVTEPAGRSFRYMKAIPVQPMCLGCHGATESMAPAIRERLAADYPQDRAVGYAPGQLRGAFSVRKPR